MQCIDDCTGENLDLSTNENAYSTELIKYFNFFVYTLSSEVSLDLISCLQK